jgi:alpha-beta hydrolase superfamily lysophospholipase
MRTPSEHLFTSHDGQQLFYRHWRAEGARRGAIVLLHRGHEHGGRMAHLVEELQLPDFEVFAWDARGNGRSPGPRGDSPSFAALARDLQCFVAHLCEQHALAQEDIAVVAQSVGAVVAATWTHDYAPKIRALVLASPAFKVKLYVPFARPGLALMHKLFGNFFVNSYVKAKFLTHDPQRIASYESDPLIARPISVRVLLGLYEAAERVVADAQAVQVPTQLLISGADWVVHHGPQHQFFDRLGSTIKEKHVLPGFYHDTLGELERAKAVEKVRRFVLQRFAEAPAIPDQRRAHEASPSQIESDALAAPLPWWSPRAWYWAITRASLKFGALFSRGLKLGEDTGYDSGSTLDFVYRNSAESGNPIGKLIDRVYLESIGWRGIRIRKQHVEELLREAMRRLRDAGSPVRVTDIAAGHGRYALEFFGSEGRRPDAITLRDYSELNVEQGRALIAQKGMGELARFERADAFDRAQVAGAHPQPTLGIVSGLYELFPDNSLLEASLGGLADAIPPGGYLVYTGQPWHPQLELIARGLTSHRQGAAWVMRRRSQREMDQLVEAAGFRKLEQRIDEFGIFTVCLAQRLA